MIFQFFSTSSLLANYGILPPVVVPVNSGGRRRRGTNQLVRKSGRENTEMEGKEWEERGKNTGKIEEKGGGTPSEHQLVRKRGRENKEKEGERKKKEKGEGTLNQHQR
jgi:hypothetical protein